MAAQRTRPELSRLLSRLKGRIRQYVFLEGTAVVIAVIGVLFWISFGLDWLYFVAQRAELPIWARFITTIAAACIVLCVLVVWVGIRTFRDFRNKALALVLERRFPELNDRLITAIELADSPEKEPALTAAMVGRTVDEVADLTDRLELGRVFDSRPLARTSLTALCLTVSVAAFAFCFEDVFHLWFRRNVLLANDAWKRETELSVSVIADPGHAAIPIKDFVYKHPRGGDLTILADVLPEKKVPDQVQFLYRFVDGTARGRSYFSKVGQSQFKNTLAGVLGSLEFTIIGGDAERRTYFVEVVDPPRIDRLAVRNLYPDYTGLNAVDEETGKITRREKQIQGTQISLPAGTDFLLHGEFNKPLVSVRIQTELYDVEISRPAAGGPPLAKLTLFHLDGQIHQGGEFALPQETPWLAPDGRSMSVPFLLTGLGKQEIVSQTGAVNLPLRLGTDALLRIFLTDEDDIRSSEPARIAINSIADESPRIETRLRGIGTSITRKALVPVTGTVTDDYGVADARFEYKLDGEENFQPRAFAHRPDGSASFELRMSETQPFERFEVLPLELSVGKKFTLSISATDGDDLNGPHITQGEKYSFQVVSEEELLSILYARELNLRQRLERILEEVKATRSDLTGQRQRLVEADELRQKAKDAEQTQEMREKLTGIEFSTTAASERGLQAVRKNHNETQAIEESIGDIREEMVNNAVETPQSLERIDERLLKRLKIVNEVDFKDIDQSLGLFRLALQDKTSPLQPLDEGLRQLDLLVSHIEEILKAMRSELSFKDLIEQLKDIKNAELELRQQTERERKRKAIEDLEKSE